MQYSKLYSLWAYFTVSGELSEFLYEVQVSVLYIRQRPIRPGHVRPTNRPTDWARPCGYGDGDGDEVKKFSFSVGQPFCFFFLVLFSDSKYIIVRRANHYGILPCAYATGV